MATAQIIDSVDIFENCHLSLPGDFPSIPPNQFHLDGFEESFDCSVIVTIALTRHGDLKVVLVQDLLISVRVILAYTIHVVDAVLRL